jgi:hypothetical protein
MRFGPVLRAQWRSSHAGAGDRGQAPGRCVRSCPCREFGVQRLDVAVELAPLRPHLRHEIMHPAARPSRGISQQRIDRQLELAPALRDDIPALEQDRPELVQKRPPGAHQTLSDPVECLHVHLVLGLQLDEPHRQLDEPHRRPRCSLGDRLGIPVVVLLRLHVGPHVFRRHQPDLMPLIGQDASHQMRAAARFHGDDRTRQPRPELDHALPPHPTSKDNGSRLVQPDDAAHRLAQIDPDDRDGHGSPSFSASVR